MERAATLTPQIKWLQAIKPRSSVMRTTLVIGVVVLISQALSIAFFWQNLYLPEIRQHAHTTAIRLEQLMIAEAEGPEAILEADISLRKLSNLYVERDPAAFPRVNSKWFAELFTDRFRRQIQREINAPVTVYFDFKPTPILWVKAPTQAEAWVREDLLFIDQYNPVLILLWVIGVPLLTLVAIVVLARQLNRPLKRLQLAAIRVGRGLHSSHLPEDSGPTEIRQVNRAFNGMTEQIRQAEQERTTMLAGISHDLRTPLTRLRLTAEFLSDRDMANGMIMDIEDMDAILDQFISFMRDGSEEPIDDVLIDELLREVAAQVQNQISCELTLADLPPLPLRRLSLKRALINVTQNAIRYGQGPLEINTFESKGYVNIIFRDHGTGIPDDQTHALMQPFRRGDQARTTQGSGLGLAIVERIIKQHQGQLILANHPDGGLQATIKLPSLVLKHNRLLQG